MRKEWMKLPWYLFRAILLADPYAMLATGDKAFFSICSASFGLISSAFGSIINALFTFSPDSWISALSFWLHRAHTKRLGRHENEEEHRELTRMVTLTAGALISKQGSKMIRTWGIGWDGTIHRKFVSILELWYTCSITFLWKRNQEGLKDTQ